MWIAFGLAFVISLVFATATLGCGFFLLGILYFWGRFQLFGSKDLDRYERVTQDNYPDIWHLVHELRADWGMGEIDIYFNPTNQINASASDFGKDFIIINKGLWHSIRDTDQRKFVVGHEMGHIGLGHSWLRILAHQADNVFERSIIGILYNFLLLHYSRMKELSADRIGLLSCKNLDAALKVLAVLEFGDEKFAGKLSDNSSNLADDFSDILSTHPDIYQRGEELIKFAKKTNLN